MKKFSLWKWQFCCLSHFPWKRVCHHFKIELNYAIVVVFPGVRTSTMESGLENCKFELHSSAILWAFLNFKFVIISREKLSAYFKVSVLLDFLLLERFTFQHFFFIQLCCLREFSDLESGVINQQHCNKYRFTLNVYHMTQMNSQLSPISMNTVFEKFCPNKCCVGACEINIFLSNCELRMNIYGAKSKMRFWGSRACFFPQLQFVTHTQFSDFSIFK